MEHSKSGLNLTGEVKDIKEIKGNGKRFILMTLNDQLPVLYKIKNAADTNKIKILRFKKLFKIILIYREHFLFYIKQEADRLMS